jgi:hypothetical protein
MRSKLFDAPESFIAKPQSIHCTKDDCQSKDGGNKCVAPFLCTCSSFDGLHFEFSTLLYVESLSSYIRRLYILYLRFTVGAVGITAYQNIYIYRSRI